MTTSVNNGHATRGRPFQRGNPGRPAGSRNKVSRQQLLDSREMFLPMADATLGRIHKHFAACSPEKDCASCRHYVSLVMHYIYGKPPQRHELVQATARRDVEATAKELGLTKEETQRALAEVDRALAAARNAQ